MKKPLFVALLLLTLAAPAAASPITVGAGQTVVVSFGTTPANWDPTDPPDYLEFTLGRLDWLGGADQQVQLAVYDGDDLLGSRVSNGMGWTFYGAETELRRDWSDYPQDLRIDFTSLLDGTVAGRFELSPLHGAFRFDPATLDLRQYSPTYIGEHPVLLWDVLAPGGWAVAQADFDWVRNVSVDVTPRHVPADVLTPVPEPGTLSLVATGLGIGWLRARKRRQRRQEDAPAR